MTAQKILMMTMRVRCIIHRGKIIGFVTSRQQAHNFIKFMTFYHENYVTNIKAIVQLKTVRAVHQQTKDSLWIMVIFCFQFAINRCRAVAIVFFSFF